MTPSRPPRVNPSGLHRVNHSIPPRGRLGLLTILALLLVLPSCATLQSLTALSQVRFDLDGVSGIRLAGVELDRVRGYEDLSVLDAARIGSALVNRQLPLEATLHVGAHNPDGNPDARLVGLDWTFFLQDRETVSGSLSQELALPSGARTDVPVSVRLDLLEFFEGSSRDLVELALSLTGVGTAREPSDLRLEALPTIQTRLGPIQYPRPLILGGQVGGGSAGT
jgi:hypothetical protein